MSDRPTPEQLTNGFKSAADAAAVDAYRARLTVNGYVIVHPDDVPNAEDSDTVGATLPGDGPKLWRSGWNACRRRIFGATP